MMLARWTRTRNIIMLAARHVGSNPWLDRLEPDTTARRNVGACFTHLSHEPRVVFQAIVKPVILRLESDQHARRLPVARDDDVAVLSQPEVAREVVLYYCERDLTARLRRGYGATRRLGFS